MSSSAKVPEEPAAAAADVPVEGKAEQPVDDADAAEAKDGPVTVFEDPQHFTVKHPLQHRWVMWYDNPGRKTSQHSWGDHLRKISSFDTVEDFWRLFNNIMPASKLVSGSNYHLFKEGIEPKWEDTANARGGKWVTVIPSKSRKSDLDRLWLWSVLACIGENLNGEEEVCGAVVSIRKAQDKIAIWTQDIESHVTIQIGKAFKQTLGLGESTTIGYQSHGEAMRRNSSFNNRCKYEV